MWVRLPVGRTVGAVALAAATAHLWGLWSPSRTVAMAGGAVLFAALAATAGRDATAGREATARRFATVLLAVGLLALAGAMGAGAVWYLPPRQAAADFGWFAYGPQPANLTAALLTATDASVARQRWYGLVMLLAVGCLAAAAVTKPRAATDDAADPAGSRQRWSAVVIAVAGVLGAGWLGWDLWSIARSFIGPVPGHLMDILAGAWPQLLTVPLAAVAAARTVRRQSAGGWWPVGASAAGLAAFAIPVALAAHNIAETLTSKWFVTPFSDARSGNTAAVQLAVVPDHAVYPAGTPGLVAGCAVVAGTILLVAGWLDRPRDAAPV
jgi:hypothetical protein